MPAKSPFLGEEKRTSSMEMTFSVGEVQQLYRDWQDGKLLNKEERLALREHFDEQPKATFKDILKAESDN
jgi:hypothetical protein